MKTMKNILIVFAVIISVAATYAQEGSNIRGLSLARTNVALARGTEALGVNPANLGLQDQRYFNLSLAPLGVRFNMEFLNLELYNKYFTGIPDTTGDGKREPLTLGDKEKQEILDAFPEEQSSIRADFDIVPIAMSFRKLPFIGGGLAFGVGQKVGVKGSLSKDFLRFFLNGFRSEGSEYKLNGTGFDAWWLGEYMVAYGRDIPIKKFGYPFPIPKDLYLGMGVKYIQGYAIIETNRFNGRFGNIPESAGQYSLVAQMDFLARSAGSPAFAGMTFNNSEIDGNPLSEPGGTGVGIDIGLSSEVITGLRVGLSVTDMGSIEWTGNTKEVVGNLDETFTGSEAEFKRWQDSSKTLLRGEVMDIGSFETQLPTKFRLGASIASDEFPYLKFLPGRMLLAMELSKGMTTTFGNSQNMRFSMGMEYRIIPLLPLRTGIAFGGDIPGTYWSVGFGLDLWAWELNLATENFGVLFFPNSTNMISYSMGMKFKI